MMELLSWLSCSLHMKKMKLLSVFGRKVAAKNSLGPPQDEGKQVFSFDKDTPRLR
ncbi:GM24525 [Drosophila sechellia]|uniref:GM24525 n=1 Tax=Drosophila sechellia TaxID=7238 RepID=B4HHU1_DROSE|nr:GM24525 [Drosophila sechellia]